MINSCLIAPYSNGGSSREETEQKQSIADCWQCLMLSENLFSRTISDSCFSGCISFVDCSVLERRQQPRGDRAEAVNRRLLAMADVV